MKPVGGVDAIPAKCLACVPDSHQHRWEESHLEVTGEGVRTPKGAKCSRHPGAEFEGAEADDTLYDADRSLKDSTKREKCDEADDPAVTRADDDLERQPECPKRDGPTRYLRHRRGERRSLKRAGDHHEEEQGVGDKKHVPAR